MIWASGVSSRYHSACIPREELLGRSRGIGPDPIARGARTATKTASKAPGSLLRVASVAEAEREHAARASDWLRGQSVRRGSGRSVRQICQPGRGAQRGPGRAPSKLSSCSLASADAWLEGLMWAWDCTSATCGAGSWAPAGDLGAALSGRASYAPSCPPESRASYRTQSRRRIPAQQPLGDPPATRCQKIKKVTKRQLIGSLWQPACPRGQGWDSLGLGVAAPHDEFWPQERVTRRDLDSDMRL